MGSPQAAISFLCAIFLSLFIFARRVREDVARLALLAWLLGCNFVHGINASIWSSTVDIEGFGWCDVVTKFVLATTIAVPGACLCISHNLAAMSSSRETPTGSRVTRNQKLFAALFCYLIPILYMPLHIIGQDHRFDLAKGIGCMASVHPSTPAAMVVWMPQIVMCILSLLCSGMTIYNRPSAKTTDYSDHIESRYLSMDTGLRSRTLIISVLTTSATLVVLVFSMFSFPMSDSWLSWAYVHEHLSEVTIMLEPSASIETMWWGLRSITFCYIFVALAFGEETRDIVRYLSSLIKRFPRADLRTILTTSHRKSDNPFHFSPDQAMELKSGWDDDFKVKSSRLTLKGWRKNKSSSPKSTRTRSSSSATEDSFLSPSSQFGLPLGHSLGYNTPILPPPIHKSSTKKPENYVDHNIIHEARPSLCSHSSSKELLSHQHHMQTASKASDITAVLGATWPSPPMAAPSPSPTRDRYISGPFDVISPTRASSPALSQCSQSSSHISRPFGEYSARPVSQSPPGLRSKAVNRRPSLKNFQSNMKGRNQSGKGQEDASIRMTVVHETA
ncbi:hypothetical protein Agabi119p4_11364 [Agaricus bisporus var. burnettii]|uniref:Uncharacterized protein n=1 Tax=Agaricus bisporus var. burnettii TaxID=192524 RepID=A0A8H7EU64_AGABI|nr:hypothetical protein Agabi119p4_11364 [Agaricus bisporus var. burnettii]